LVFERYNMGLDGLLFCKRAEVSVPFLLLDVRFRDRLLLEHGKGAGKDPDFVMAFGISRVDGKIARRDLQHGVANGVQRIDEAAAERHHADQGESESACQQRRLENQRFLRRRPQRQSSALRLLKRGLGDGDRASHAAARDRAPLTCGDLRLFARHPRVRDPIAQGQILRIEIGGLRQRQRIDQTFWYAAPVTSCSTPVQAVSMPPTNRV
jgi:hypothetical protein